MAYSNSNLHTNTIEVFNPIKDEKKQRNCDCCSNSCEKTHPLPLSESICEITNTACNGGYGMDDIRCCAFVLTPITFVLDLVSCPFRLSINLCSK
jgi:hypothetical protein